MARPLSWSDVRGGVIALLVIVVVAASILRFLRVGALHGDTMRVYVMVGEARGLTPGSEVWLSGQKIGKVADITFQPPTADSSRRIRIEMRLLSQYREAVHHDATAQVGAGGSIIGAVVVHLTPGIVRARTIADGDTIVAKPQADVEGATTQLGRASAEVPAMMANVKALVGELQSTRGTIGAAINGPGLTALRQTRLQALRIGDRSFSRGTVGRVMSGQLGARVSHVMAGVDSVRALVGSDRTSLGRFRKDSTLMRNVDDIRLQLAEVQRSLDAPSGTAGRVMRDSILGIQVDSARREMTLLFADIKKHPFRYLSF